MIHLKKSLSKRPEDWHEVAVDETKRAKSHFGTRKTRGKEFRFKAYRDPRLKAALHEIFKGKCAYCEVGYAAGQPGDVEHFRPKARIREGQKLIRPGYYWLAADWTNLLPSCIDCNRLRKYKFEGGLVESRGKGDQFPLANPQKRAKRPGRETHERALLLDPCKCNPERHLEFPRVRFRLGLVRPALMGSHRESIRGRYSIRVYGLDRPDLVKARQDQAKRLRYLMKDLCKVCSRLAKSPASRELQCDLEKLVQELAGGFLAVDRAFLGMARQMVFPVTYALARRSTLKQFASKLKPILPFPTWRRFNRV